jgi:hypothetical protein
LDDDEEESHPAEPHPVAHADERSFAHQTGPLADAHAPASHPAAAQTAAPVKPAGPPPVPAFTPEILARRKDQWKEAAQKQIDAQIDAASKPLIAKAQQAGGQLGATFVSEQFTALRKQFADEALAVFPNSDKVKQLAAVYPARLQNVTRNVTAQLAGGQFQQHAKNWQAAKVLRQQWEQKVNAPVSGLPDSEDATKKLCQTEKGKFESALRAGQFADAAKIFETVSNETVPKALARYSLELNKKAYLEQMKKIASPELNPNHKFDPKLMDQWADIVSDLKDHTGNGLSEAEVLAIRVYTSNNYKYLNPAVANQRDRKDRPKDWMDTQNKPGEAQARSALTKEGNPNPSQEQIEAKTKELVDEYEKHGKQTRYEEGSLHAGMIMEAFKKLPAEEKTLYRGARMTPARFQSEFEGKKTIEYEAFASKSEDKDKARGFANGIDGAPADATVSVFIEALAYEARNIQKISLLKGEKEFLLEAESIFDVVEIRDEPENSRHPGFYPKAPIATAWKYIRLKQRAKAQGLKEK